jgi:hypothetical protein
MFHICAFVGLRLPRRVEAVHALQRIVERQHQQREHARHEQKEPAHLNSPFQYRDKHAAIPQRRDTAEHDNGTNQTERGTIEQE